MIVNNGLMRQGLSRGCSLPWASKFNDAYLRGKCQRLTPERGNNHPITEVSSFNAHIKNDVQPASSQEEGMEGRQGDLSAHNPRRQKQRCMTRMPYQPEGTGWK
jgi:hypothetical protein